MNAEDHLHQQLIEEFGDPQASGPGPAGDWTSIERQGAARTRRRRLAGAAAAAVVVLAVGAAAVALGGHRSTTTSLASRGTGPTSSQPGTTVTLVPTTAIAPATVVTTTPVGPVTTLGPSTSVPPTATTTVTTPGGQIDCGTAYLASGWPTTIAPSPTLAQCILDAFAAGTPAIYRERAQTDGNGGHIEITTYQVTGRQKVWRTVDATGAQPPGGVTVSACTGLAAGPDSQLVASGCVAG
jgi:hypothetical protein